MNGRETKAFTLPEFVIGVVFVAVVLGPLLLYVARIQTLNSIVGQQGRLEGWRSFNDQAVTMGINPTLAPAMSHALNPAVPSMTPLTVAVDSSIAIPGLPRIVPLHLQLDQSVVEPRIAASGYQIGAGALLAPRSVPKAPLAPIIMPRPVLTPNDGTVIQPAILTPSTPGAAYLLPVQAASAGNVIVRAILNQPYGTFSGSGAAQFSVSAVDLLHGVNGTAWTEYSGDAASGDRPVVLADGRTRWLVTTSEHRLQIYEPSPATGFAYTIALGAPILIQRTVERASGESLSFDYTSYLQVQSGEVSLQIDFPRSVKAVFGSAWAAESIGYRWTFGGVAGPFSGSLQSFFAEQALLLWSDRVEVAAAAVVPAGAVATPATWSFVRLKSDLGVPLLSSESDSGGMFAAGFLQFTAPNGPGGAPIGRLSFDNGTAVSTGSSLSVNIIP